MNLIAERDGAVVVLGEGFTFESAYEFIIEREEAENFTFDLVLIDGETRYLFEVDCWVGWEFKDGQWVETTVAV
jgi:hypothetical protein